MRKHRLQRSTTALTAVLLAAWAVGTVSASDPAVVRIGDRTPESVIRITDRVVRGQSPVDMTQPGVQPAGLFSHCENSAVCSDDCLPGHVCLSDSCGSGSTCSTGGCGHRCAIIGCMVNMFSACHEAKCDLLCKLGIPCHCRQECQTGRCRRLRTRSYICRAHDHEEWCKCRDDRACERRERFGNWLMHSRLNYFIPRGCCGKGCPPIGCYTMVYPVDPWYGDCRDGSIYAAEGQGGPVSVPLAPVIRHTFNYGWGVPSSRLTPVSHLATRPYYGYGPSAPWAGSYNPYYAQTGPTMTPSPQLVGGE